MPELAAIYLVGFASGIVLGAVGMFIALTRTADGWQDVQKGTTKLQLLERAGIGVAKKKPD